MKAGAPAYLAPPAVLLPLLAAAMPGLDNAWMLLLLLANGLSCVRLSLVSGAGAAGGALAGVAGTLLPVAVQDVSDGRLSQAMVWPAVLALADTLVTSRTGRSAPAVRAGLLFALAAVVAACNAFALAMGAALLLALDRVLSPREGRVALRLEARALALSGLTAAAALLPLLLAAFPVLARAEGAAHASSGMTEEVRELLMSRSLSLGTLLGLLPTAAEDHLPLVQIPVVLWIAAAVGALLAPGRAAPWLLGLLPLAVLAMGPELQLVPVPDHSQGRGMALPFALVREHVPGFALFLHPARFMIVGSVFLLVAAGLGLEALAARYGRRWGAGLAAAACLALLLVHGYAGGNLWQSLRDGRAGGLSRPRPACMGPASANTLSGPSQKLILRVGQRVEGAPPDMAAGDGL